MEAQEILQDIIFVILYGGVMGLSMAAAFYLLLRRSNAIAPGVTPPKRLRLWAAAIMLESVFSHILWLLYFCHPSALVYIIVCTLDILLLIPIIAGILLSMLQDRHRPVWPVAVALVPAIVLAALNIIYKENAFLTWQSIYVIAVYAVLMVYMYFAVRRYGRWLRDNYADLENKEVWQSFLILAVFMLFSVLYLFTSGQTKVLIYLLEFVCVIIMGLVLWRVETLQSLSESSTVEVEEPAEEVLKASAQTTNPSKMDTLLKKHCEDNQLYLQNDLTLTQLANAIGTNRTYLSQHFAQQGITYNAYINGLRIRHFVHLYQEAVAAGREITAQQLSFESGYRSYSTFSTTFKQIMGTTVAAWMHSSDK
jgi:AraC-like DNA-binding protein